MKPQNNDDTLIKFDLDNFQFNVVYDSALTLSDLTVSDISDELTMTLNAAEEKLELEEDSEDKNLNSDSKTCFFMQFLH